MADSQMAPEDKQTQMAHNQKAVGSHWFWKLAVEHVTVVLNLAQT